MMKKRNFLFICVFTLLILLLALYIYHQPKEKVKDLLPFDDLAEEWNGSQDLSHDSGTMETIEIPGYESMTFYNSEKSQKVNIYNPSKNNCLFKITLIIDDQILWQSGYIESGKGYYNIEVAEMPCGEYDAIMKVECFRKDGTALNGAELATKIIYKE